LDTIDTAALTNGIAQIPTQRPVRTGAGTAAGETTSTTAFARLPAAGASAHTSRRIADLAHATAIVERHK